MDSDDVHNDFISVQLVQDQSNEKGNSRITGLERLINLQEIYRYNRWVLLVMK
jgi:hypothetical protein